MPDRLHFARFRKFRLRGAAAIAVLVTSACGTTPATHFHSLMPAEIVAHASAPAAAGIAVVLEPIRLPAQVDQPQWLVQAGDGSVALLEQERWASPLRDEFRQALLEELIVGQGAIDARTQPTANPAAVRVGVDLRRFDSLLGREARIEGSWTISGSDSRSSSARCEWLIREAAPGSFAALAAAHRRAVVRLGAAIGQALARARRGEPPSCPAADAEPR
jgi:uncharacterized protein